MGIFSRRPSTMVEPTSTVRSHAHVAEGETDGVALDPTLRSLTGRWTIDRPHSRIGFSVRHAMVTTVRGAFTDYDSTLYFDGVRPSESRADLVIRVASVD